MRRRRTLHIALSLALCHALPSLSLAQTPAGPSCHTNTSLGFESLVGSKYSAQCAGTLDSGKLKSILKHVAYSHGDANDNTFSWAKGAFYALHGRDMLAPSDWRAYLRSAFVSWKFDEIDTLRMLDTEGVWLDDVHLPLAINNLSNGSLVKSLWTIDAQNRSLTEVFFPSDRDDFILIVFSPLCNPCRRAAHEIVNDPELYRLFSRCGIWAAQLDQTFSFKQYQHWARSFPAFTPFFIKNWEQYYLAPPRLTPTFYAFKAGRPIGRVDGWPREAAKSQFLSTLGTQVSPLSCLREASQQTR